MQWASDTTIEDLITSLEEVNKLTLLVEMPSSVHIEKFADLGCLSTEMFEKLFTFLATDQQVFNFSNGQLSGETNELTEYYSLHKDEQLKKEMN